MKPEEIVDCVLFLFENFPCCMETLPDGRVRFETVFSGQTAEFLHTWQVSEIAKEDARWAMLEDLAA